MHENISTTHASRISLLRQVAVTLLILALTAFSGVTYAWLTTTTNTESNPFSTQDVKLTVLESFDGGTTDTISSGVVSDVELGETTKMVAFGAPTGAADCVVRASFSPQLVTDPQASDTVYRFFNSGVLTEPNAQNEVVMGDVTLHFAADWRDKWTFRSTGSGNGFFYYNQVLSAGQKTPYLLVGVTYNGDATALADQIEVVVNAEALQAMPQEALDEWGLTITP